MDFNIVKIGAFIALIIVYLTVRKLLKKFADFTENIGQSSDSSEKMQEEIESLNSKVINLEQKINNKQ